MLLEIVTPEGKVFSDDVSVVVLPGALGEMGVLPKHANLVSTLTAGELRYTKDSRTFELAIGAGFAEITGERVNVLTEMALRDSDIDETAVQTALDRAQARLKEDVLPEEIAAVEAAIANSIAQLHLKRKRKTI